MLMFCKWKTFFKKQHKKQSKFSDAYKISSCINLCFITQMYTKIIVWWTSTFKFPFSFFWIMNAFYQDPEKVNSMIKDMKKFHMVRYWRGVDYLTIAADFADV